MAYILGGTRKWLGYRSGIAALGETRIDPSTLPNVLLLIDPRQAVYKNQAGTIPATVDGDVVLNVPNRAPGSSVSFNSSANGYTYKTGGQNGKPYLRASTSYLPGSAGIACSASTTTFIVAQRNNTTNFYQAALYANNYYFLGSGPSGGFAHFFGNGSGWSTIRDLGANWPKNGEVVAFATVNDAGDLQAYANGVNCPCGRRTDAMAAATITFNMGGASAGSQNFDGDIYYKIVLDGVLTLQQREGVLAYLRSEYSLPKPDAIVIPTLTDAGPKIATVAATWRAQDVANPDIFRDTINDRYVMNVSGYQSSAGKWKTGLFYSTGLNTWTEEPTNPVFSPVINEGYIAANGTIALKGSTYYFWYQVDFQTGTTGPGICLATSPDLLTWTRQNSGNPLSLRTGNSNGAFDPKVRLLNDGVTFEFAYVEQTTAESRWVTVSRSTDGINWTEQYRFPLSWATSGQGEPSYWDSPYGPRYIHDSDPSGNGHRRLYLARPAGTGIWATDPSYLLLGPVATYGTDQVFDSSPYVGLDGILRVFHAGANTSGLSQDMGSQIGVSVPPVTPVPPGTAAAFDGDPGNFLSAVDASLAPTGLSWSWAGWVYLVANNDYYYMVDQGDTNLRIRTYPNGYFNVEVSDELSGYTSINGGTTTLNIWHFLVVTYDTATMLFSFYVDNVLMDSITLVDTPLTTNTVAIGVPFNGRIDSLAYYTNRCLSAGDVTYLWNDGNGFRFNNIDSDAKVNLRSWWDMEEETGTRVDALTNINLTEKWCSRPFGWRGITYKGITMKRFALACAFVLSVFICIAKADPHSDAEDAQMAASGEQSDAYLANGETYSAYNHLRTRYNAASKEYENTKGSMTPEDRNSCGADLALADTALSNALNKLLDADSKQSSGDDYWVNGNGFMAASSWVNAKTSYDTAYWRYSDELGFLSTTYGYNTDAGFYLDSAENLLGW
jgi:hypothetical protein